jgi:hypothetical protein
MGIRNQKESNGEETSLTAGGYLLSIHWNAHTYTCILILVNVGVPKSLIHDSRHIYVTSIDVGLLDVERFAVVKKSIRLFLPSCPCVLRAGSWTAYPAVFCSSVPEVYCQMLSRTSEGYPEYVFIGK